MRAGFLDADRAENIPRTTGLAVHDGIESAALDGIGLLVHDHHEGHIAFVQRSGRMPDPGEVHSIKFGVAKLSLLYMPQVAAFAKALRRPRVKAAWASPIAAARAQ